MSILTLVERILESERVWLYQLDVILSQQDGCVNFDCNPSPSNASIKKIRAHTTKFIRAKKYVFLRIKRRV